MVDREKILAILRKRFPSSPADEMAAAANAIVGLRDEWREVENFEAELAQHLGACTCADPDWFVRRFTQGHRFKLFERAE